MELLGSHCLSAGIPCGIPTSKKSFIAVCLFPLPIGGVTLSGRAQTFSRLIHYSVPIAYRQASLSGCAKDS